MFLVRSTLGPVAGAAAVLCVLSSCSSGQPAAPTFDTVTRATVTTGVTASGALAASSTEELGFAQGGKLTSVKVKVGQKVHEGDVLARIDSTAAKKALEAADANLTAQGAGLGSAADSTSVSGASASLAQARRVLAATQRQADAVANADTKAIARAKKQRSVDSDAQDQAEDAVGTLQDLCDAAPADPTTDPAGAAAASTACTQLVSAKAAVTAAKQRIAADDTTVVAAEQKKKVDVAAGCLSVQSSRQGVVSAQNTYDAAAAARPHTIDASQAQVDAAQAQVDAAQKIVDDTVLRAPTDGTISAVNGAKGEFVSASTGTSALAPGSKAAIPGASGAGASSAAGAASPTRPGGTQFIVLSGLDRLQVVLPFEESDAAQIATGQSVDVQLDAVPDLEAHGTVVSVSPSATPISGVVSYYATVSLDGRDPRERDGQTARATIVTTEHPDVLTVPNTAVKQQGGASTVVVYQSNGDQQVVTFEPGLVGADRTEVLSGLSEGDRVVVPSHP